MYLPRLAAGGLPHNLVGTQHIITAVACCRSAVRQSSGQTTAFLKCCGLLQVGWDTKLWAEEFALALEHEDGRFPRDQAAVAHNSPQAAGEGRGAASGQMSAPLMRRQVVCTALVAAPDIVQQSCSAAGCCFACPLHFLYWKNPLL